MIEGKQCQFHNVNKKIMFCWNLQCRAQRIHCPTCIQDFHSDHRADVVSISSLSQFSELKRLIMHSKYQPNKSSRVSLKYLNASIQLGQNVLNWLQKFCQKIAVFSKQIIRDVQQFILKPRIAIRNCFQQSSLQKTIQKMLDQSLAKDELDFIALTINKFKADQFKNIETLQQIILLSTDKLQNSIEFFHSIFGNMSKQLKKWGIFEVQNWKQKIKINKEKIQKQMMKQTKNKEYVNKDKKQAQIKKINKIYTQYQTVLPNVPMKPLSSWGKFIEDHVGHKYTLQEWKATGRGLLDIDTVNLTNKKLQYFPQQFTKLRNLKKLYLDSNKLEQITALQAFSHLQLLSITNNRLKNIDGLRSLPYLKEVYIYHNNLPEQIIEELKLLNAKGYSYYFNLRDSL